MSQSESEAILTELDAQVQSLVALRARLASTFGLANADGLGNTDDPTLGWVRENEFDRRDFAYAWPDGTTDQIPNLEVWRAPASLGGGLFAVGEAAEAMHTFGRPRRYAGVFVLGAGGGSHRHVVNLSEDDRGGWVALIRGTGLSKRGYYAPDEPLPAGYEYLPTAVHAERVDNGWNRACVVAEPGRREIMLAHAALQARDRGIGPMGS